MKTQQLFKFSIWLMPFFMLIWSTHSIPASQIAFEIEICSEVFAYNGEAFFCGKHRRYGKELFRSNGTPQGTKVVADLDAGLGGSGPNTFFILKDKLYFFAETTVTGMQLWRTDGTEAGTKRISYSLSPDEMIHDHLELLRDDQFVYFRMGDGWWRTDGSADGTVRITNYDATAISAFGGNFYFVNFVDLNYSDRTQNVEELKLSRIRQDSIQSTEVKNFGAGCSVGEYPEQDTVALNNKLYFSVRCLDGQGTSDVDALFVSDGTSAGTSKAVEGMIELLGELNDSLYFYNLTSNKIQGIHGDTIRTVKDCNLDLCGGVNTRYFSLYDRSPSMVLKGKLFFHLLDKNFDEQLWSTDGTVENTLKVNDFEAYLYANNHDLLLYIESSNFGRLWVTDGTTSGTELLNLPNGHNAEVVLSIGRRFLIFSYDFTTRKKVLWTSTGSQSTTKKLASFGGFQNFDFSGIEGSRFYFPNNGILWHTNAETNGTYKVTYLDNIRKERIGWLASVINLLLDNH